MDVIRIKGGIPLKGKVRVSGAKNAALPIMAATLLTDKPCTLHRVPNLSDVRFFGEILQYLGAEVEQIESETWRIRAQHINAKAPYELVRKMRASICLLGSLVGRLRHAEVSLPGGCIIGPRPIDLHLKGLTKLGCEVKIENGYIHVNGNRMTGADIFLGGRFGTTATGTANILMAAVLAPGKTRIESAACEPEIVDLCHMLTAMGAKLEGIGGHALTITGVENLHGCEHHIIADRIETGTFILAGAITGGDITITDSEPNHLRALLDKLEESNIPVTVNENGDINVACDTQNRRPVDIITLPHPGFPTDLQAQMCALLSVTPGLSIITERVFPNRFMHVPELQRMGADIAIEGPSAIIQGKPGLSGAPVMASDLRASAALLLSGLAASGETWIQRIYHLDRGYDKIDAKLQSLGADIARMSVEEMPKDLQAEAV